MTKINKDSNNNIVTFPKKSNNGEREVEAIVFAALEPLDIDTIESKITKKINVLKTLEKLQIEYSTRGIKGSIKSIYSTEYKLNLYELLKTYSGVIMTKDFQRMNIPKLPVFTTEDGIKRIREFFGKLIDWKNIDDLIPLNFKNGTTYEKTGKAGIFAGSLELVKEGNLTIKQENLFDDIYVKEIK